MKNNLFNQLFVASLLLFSIAISSCRKGFETAGPAVYDEQNRVFRVKISSVEKTPYKLSIRRVNKDSSVDPIDLIEVDQRTGAAFEYGFTPAIGEAITVTVSSNKQNIDAYAHYKGKDTWRVNLVMVGVENYAGEFNYTVAN
jgi:hypothetical protein